MTTTELLSVWKGAGLLPAEWFLQTATLTDGSAERAAENIRH